MKQTILEKLTSRKFWAAIATIVAGLIMLFGCAETTAETISGAIMVIGGAVGYMIAEGIVDAKSIGQLLDGAEIIVNEVLDKTTEKDGEQE